MNIDGSSMVLKATISVAKQDKGRSGAVMVEISMTNMTKGEVVLSDMGVTFEVRYKNTGMLLSETRFGCIDHFFSDCHTTWGGPQKFPPPEWRLRPNETVDIGNADLGIEYKLSPGDVTVVGYLCHINKHDGPDCYKTNQIEVTVP